MQTYIKKGFHGWEARTELSLTDNKVLTVLTMKRHNGQLITTASVGHVENGFVSHIMHQDFNAIIAATTPKRVTDKAVTAQHNGIEWEAVKASALAHYQ